MRCPLTPNQAQLARAGRCLNGLAQTINLGANIFLADDGGRYSVASAIIASAAHAGPASPSIEAAHLNDDLHVVTLSMKCLLQRQSSFGQTLRSASWFRLMSKQSC